MEPGRNHEGRGTCSIGRTRYTYFTIQGGRGVVGMGGYTASEERCHLATF